MQLKLLPYTQTLFRGPIMRNLFFSLPCFFCCLMLSSCSDIKKLKEENKTLSEKVTAYEQNIAELSAKLATTESSLLAATAELAQVKGERDQFKTDSDKLQTVESELASLRESDRGFYDKTLSLHNKSQESLALADLTEAQTSWETFLQKYPNSDLVTKAQEYLKETKKQALIAGPIAEGERKIDEALKKYEFNNAYYELNKIKNDLPKDRFNKNRKKIEEAIKRPIIFANYDEFYDNSVAGLWLDARYKVYAKIDSKGVRFCNPTLPDCSFEHSVKVRKQLSKKKEGELKKIFGKASCFDIFMKNKWIYIRDFKEQECPAATSPEEEATDL